MRKATGSYYTYSIPGKTAALVPEFAVEHLSSEKCSQVPVLAVKDLPLGKTHDDHLRDTRTEYCRIFIFPY